MGNWKDGLVSAQTNGSEFRSYHVCGKAGIVMWTCNHSSVKIWRVSELAISAVQRYLSCVSWFCMDFLVQGAYLPGDYNLRKTQVLISWGKSLNDWMKNIFLLHRYAKIYQEEIWWNVFEVGIFPFGLHILFFLYNLIAVFIYRSAKDQKALWVFWSCCSECGRKNRKRYKIVGKFTEWKVGWLSSL